MNTIDYETLIIKIELHELWLTDSNLGDRLILIGYNLADLELTDYDLSNSVFINSNLKNLKLTEVNLTNANLINTNLENAIFVDVNLTNVKLRNSRLKNSNLSECVLIDSNLIFADLSYSNLQSSDLTSANLSKANLINSNLISVNLTLANLTNANLINGNLTNANLTNTILTLSNLTNANLTNIIRPTKTLDVKVGNIYWKRFDLGLINNNHQFNLGINTLNIGDVFASDPRILCSYPGFHFASRSWCATHFPNKPLEAKIVIPPEAEINEPWATDGSASSNMIEILEVYNSKTGANITNEIRTLLGN